SNADYKIAQNLIKQRELEWQLARSRALPRLTGVFNYSTSYFDNEFTLFDSGAQWFESGFWGVNLEVPLFSSLGRSANTKRAKIALEQAETQLTETEQQIRLNWETAVNNYNFFINSYQTSKSNLQLAERIVNKNEIKFSNGIATSFELRQAQLQLYTAQQEYLQSLLNIIDQKAELETLLNTYN
ncbi:MAG: TolC family protein, partial [Flavobacteriaceae bacterium]|nr:TolC family protein [Flavobacteriaceae bacterium]